MTEQLEFHNVAIFGSGTMGAGIAQLCAVAGSRVWMQDVNEEYLDRGMERIRASLAKGVEKGKITAEQSDRALAHIHTVQIDSSEDLRSAVEGVDLVIEAVPEDISLKRQLFQDIAQLTSPSTVFATNTSSLALAEVFSGVPGPERCIGTHFFNPPPLMPLLEVVQLENTSQENVERILDFARHLGKEPILVQDSPGFATSRLGVCLGLEAIRMVEAGVAAPADIDKAMELGYRHPMGPLKLTDLVGLDVRMAIADYLREALDSPAFAVPELMRQMVRDGRLGKKSGEGFYSWEDDD